MSHPTWQVLAIQWLSDNHSEPIIAIPAGSWKILTEFLIDSRAQMSVITNETAQTLGVRPGRRRVKFTGIDDMVKKCPTTKIALWLPGECRLTRAEALVGAAHTNLLGL